MIKKLSLLILLSFFSLYGGEIRLLSLFDSNTTEQSLLKEGVHSFNIAQNDTTLTLLPSSSLYTPFFASVALKMGWIGAVVVPKEKINTLFPLAKNKSLSERLNAKGLQLILNSPTVYMISRQKLSPETLLLIGNHLSSLISTQVALNP